MVLSVTEAPPTVHESFACTACGRMYKHKSSLGLHQRYECGKEAQFQCSLCPYKAKQKISLRKHIMFKHSVYPPV